MKNAQTPRPEHAKNELQHYLHERPALVLKMLDIAEACWQESSKPAVLNAMSPARRLQRAS